VAEHRPGAATDVEDAPPIGSVLAQVAVEDLEQDAPPADEPPVDVFDLAVLGVILALQVSLERGWTGSRSVVSTDGIVAFGP
jgi:hypothetical protein